jgi:hypothetical protein
LRKNIIWYNNACLWCYTIQCRKLMTMAVILIIYISSPFFNRSQRSRMWNDDNRLELAQDGVQWRSFLNLAMNLRVTEAGYLFTSWVSMNCSRYWTRATRNPLVGGGTKGWSAPFHKHASTPATQITATNGDNCRTMCLEQE